MKGWHIPRRLTLGALFLIPSLLSLPAAAGLMLSSAVFHNGTTTTPPNNGLTVAPAAKTGDMIQELHYNFKSAPVNATVGAKITFGTAFTNVKAVRFHVQAPLTVKISVRLVDSAGQVHVQPIARGAAPPDDLGWMTPTVTYSGSLKEITLQVDKISHASEVGIANFRQLEIWQGDSPSNSRPDIDRVVDIPTPVFVATSPNSSLPAGALNTVNPANGDRHMRLRFDFNQPGDIEYAAASLTPTQPTAARYVRFRMMAPTHMALGVRVTDPAGQSVDFAVDRSNEMPDVSGWVTRTVRIDDFGPVAANKMGKPRQVAKVAIYVKKSGSPASGSLYLRQVDLLDAAPSPSTLFWKPDNWTWVEDDVGGNTGGDTVTSQNDSRGSYTRLTYDFNLNAAAATALTTFPTAKAGNTLRMLVKAPAGLRIGIRYTDQGQNDAQIMDISGIKPYGALGDDSWAAYTFRLDRPEGLDKNRPYSGLLKNVRLRILPSDDDKYSGVYRTGEVLIRDARLTLEDDQLDLSARAPVQVGLGRQGEDLSELLGVAIPVAHDLQDIQRAADMGFKTVRLDLTWETAQNPGGTYNMAAFQPAVKKIVDLQMRPLLVLAYNNSRNTCGTGLCQEKSGIAKDPPGNPTFTAYLDYVREAARYFGTLTQGQAWYEVWNEPNLVTFWQPTPHAGDYAALLGQATAIIKQEAHDAKVVSGGLARPNVFPYLTTLTSQANLSQVDGLGYHTYHSRDPEWQTSYAVAMNKMMWASEGRPSVWITEVGESSALKDGDDDGQSSENRRKQAVNLSRTILGSWALGTPMHNVYQLRDRNGQISAYNNKRREDNFGLITADAPPADKPAKAAVQQLMAAAKGRGYEGMITAVPSAIQAMKFAQPGRETVYVAWASTVNASGWVTVPKTCNLGLNLKGEASSSSGCVTDVVGGAVPQGGVCVEGAHGCAVTRCEDIGANDRMRCKVSEAEGPIFIRVAAP